MKNFNLGLFSYMVKSVGMKCMADVTLGNPVPDSELAKVVTTDDYVERAKVVAQILDSKITGKQIIDYKGNLYTISAQTIGVIKRTRDGKSSNEIFIAATEAQDTKKKVKEAQKAAVAAAPLTALPIIEAQQNAVASVQVGHEQEINAITDITKKDIAIVKKTVKAKTLDQRNHFDLLSNLNADNQVDNINRDFVNEWALKTALSQASKAPNTIDTVYERVTGKIPNWETPKETVVQFQTSLRVAMSVIRQLGGGNAGLDVLLQGKTDKFLEKVAKKVAANKNKPLEIKIEDSKNLSPTMHNMLGIAGTIGIAILSQGIIVVGHENSVMVSEDFIKKEESDKEGGFWNTLGSAATWVKEAFLGRRLSFTVFGKERVADYKKNITDFTKQVMSWKSDTSTDSITDPILKSAFETALHTAKAAKIDLTKPEEFAKIQKALIQSYIIGEGFKNEGSNWSGSVGILSLIAVHRDEIGREVLQTGVSDYTKIEKSLTKKDIEKSDYEKMGITIENPKPDEWIYSIPVTLQLSGDDETMPVKTSTTLSKNKKSYIYTFSKPQHLSLSLVDDEYVPTFSDAVRVTPIVTLNAQPVTKLLRDRITELDKKPIADMLYIIGHMHEFDGLILKLASQDFTGAKDLLTTMSKNKKEKYRTLAGKLLTASKTIDLSTWTSYMYGSSKSRAKQEYTQKYADDSVRTEKTIRSEERLAKKLHLPKTNEKDFQISSSGTYTPKQASDIFGDRSMTIASFATPAGAVHRLDTYDGSVTMSDKTKEIGGIAEKTLIIEAIYKASMANKGMNLELNKLNTFIALTNKTNKSPIAPPISIEEYKAYLASGDIKDLGNITGLVVAAGKTPKVFEGRAMIAGNVCLNRLYGIIYPAFVLGGTKQPIPPVVSFDSSTLLNEVTTTTTTSDIAINPIAVLSKTTKTETTPGKATTRIDSREIMLTPQNTVVDGNKVTIVLEDGKTVVANLADLTRDQAMAILGRTPGANFTVVQTVTEVGTAITTTVTTGAEGFNKLIAAIAVLLGESVHAIESEMSKKSTK